MFESVRLAGTRYQYFAVSEWNVEGTCMCNGHASMCAPAPGEAIAQNKVHELRQARCEIPAKLLAEMYPA